MVADYDDDLLEYTRWRDVNDPDTAEIKHQAAAFVKKIIVLYSEGKCLNVACYTQHALESMKEIRLITIGAETRSIGGALSRDTADAADDDSW
eukprot:12980791-Alexandrium_andersonii.AAC.1